MPLLIPEVVSDMSLAKQLSYLQVFYELCSCTSRLAVLRAGVLGEAPSDSGSLPCTDECAAALHALQRSFQVAQDMCSIADFDRHFVAPGEATHLPDLDNYVTPAQHSVGVMALAAAERDLWIGERSAIVKKLVKDIQDATPSGWSLKKNELLDPCNGSTVASLLGNAHFSKLSQSVGELCAKFTVLQNAKKTCGTHLVPPDIWESCKTGLASGSETVSITYALHHAQKVIPKLTTQPQRKAAVVKLRADVRSRGVDMGASLTAELTRLESLP